MTDWYAEVRAKVDAFTTDNCTCYGWTAGGTDEMKAALLSVLNDHKPRETGDPVEPDYTCSSCFYFSGDWPCSTVWGIARALGIEVPDA